MTDRPGKLRGQTALVTGAAKRIGRLISLVLAERGANVAVHYGRSADEAAVLVDELRASGVKAAAVQADLADPAQVAGLVGKAAETLGPLDILVNNAAVYDPSRFKDRSEAHLALNVQINATAPVELSKLFAAQEKGSRSLFSIVNMLDATAGDRDRNSAYHQSKRMLLEATQRMAVELAPGVRVNAVAPGLILPPDSRDPDAFEKLAHTNPLNTVGSAQDVVDAVIFLLTSDFITGQVLYVDGGRHLKKRQPVGRGQ